MDRPEAVPSLSSEALLKILSTKYFGRPTLVYDRVTSTNALGFEIAQKEDSHGAVILAEQQTAGKGRLGRTWYSPNRKNLYFSIVLLPQMSLASLCWLPLLTGLALAESLETLTDLPISLKWPNDILIRDKKLAGILCEAKQQEGKGRVVVIGVGINLNSEKKDFPAILQETATSLKIESFQDFDRHTLLASFLESIERRYDELLLAGVDMIRSLYISRCATLQRSIRVSFLSGKEIEGFATDIGSEGELRMIPSNIQGDLSAIEIRSGDVFHVR